MSYNEYKESVKKAFTKMMPKLSQKQIDEYFAEKETDETIREEYDDYAEDNSLAQLSPESTANCLMMLY